MAERVQKRRFPSEWMGSGVRLVAPGRLGVIPTVPSGAFLVVVLAFFLWSPALRQAGAHDSPEHVIEALTARIKAVGPKPELLWRRATEYRVLGRLPEAEKDLKSAVRRKKDYTQAYIDLSRVQLARGSLKAALRTIRRASSVNAGSTADPGVLMVEAEILAASGRVGDAVAACDRAIATGSTDPEWYLFRSRFQYKLGRYADAAAGLRAGVERTGNAVLEAEWIDAAIDAGQSRSVLPTINAQLAENRYRASWLIRRGRAEFSQGNVSSAHADLLEAIRELSGRLAHRADFTLLTDRGLAYALVGDMKQARADLARARLLGADDWSLVRLEGAVEAASR